MLTGDETISSGVVFIDGISIIENIRKVSVFLITGFCPKGGGNQAGGWETWKGSWKNSDI